MRDLTVSANTTTWIAEENDRRAGFAIAEWKQVQGETVAYVATLEVIPEARRRGVGGELLARIEGSVREAGASLIWLHVDSQNAGAVRLYESRGFRCEGREENYYPKGRAGLIYVKGLE
jgi:ribosomal-protein-alanine N-acetyltransferase